MRPGVDITPGLIQFARLCTAVQALRIAAMRVPNKTPDRRLQVFPSAQKLGGQRRRAMRNLGPVVTHTFDALESHQVSYPSDGRDLRSYLMVFATRAAAATREPALDADDELVVQELLPTIPEAVGFRPPRR